MINPQCTTALDKQVLQQKLIQNPQQTVKETNLKISNELKQKEQKNLEIKLKKQEF